ncbi:MAG: hypothetical protein HY302_16315 [Opitutae bacterium]|nr:hypothetical protein [Opitutae bacterium]
MKTPSPFSRPFARRGSVLVVALIFAVIIGISLVSYLKLSTNALKQADRSFFSLAAANLAEIGIEEALTSVNRSIRGDATAWTTPSWTISGANATRTITFSGVSAPAPNATGTIKIYVQNYSGSSSYVSPSTTGSSGHEEEDHDEHEDDHDEHEDDHDEHADDHDEHADDHFAEVRAAAAVASTMPALPSDFIRDRYDGRVYYGGFADFDDHSDDHSEDDHSEDDHTEDDHSEDDHSEDTHTEDSHSTSTTTAAPAGSTSGLIVIVVKATITPAAGNGPSVSKYVEVTLSRRSYFGLGLVARDSITFAGTPAVDSWNSDPDNSSATAAIAYSTTVRTSNATVATTSSAAGAVNIGNGDILGYLRTGGGAPTIGASGKVHAAGSTLHNPARVSTDFSAAFPTVTVPSPSVTNSVTTPITATTSFPRTGDSAASDGAYYYNFTSSALIDLTGGSKVLTVAQNCVFILNNHALLTAINLSGNASASINATASLQIYTNGNLSLAGNGVVNAATQHVKCLIFSTNTGTSAQTISISGNGSLKACLYAPYADVTINGGGSSGGVYGSVIGKTIAMNGGCNFHFDESLQVGASTNPVRVGKWKELRTASERAAYESALSF